MKVSDPAISITGLKFNYGNRSVLNEINLEIPRGISFGILGANGTGKTTLVRLLIGQLKPITVSISVFGITSEHSRLYT